MADLSNENTHDALVNFVLSLPEVKAIPEALQTTAKNELEKIGTNIKRKSREELETVLLAPLEFLTRLLFLDPASPSS